MPDPSLEVDLWGFEWVVGRQDEEEFEFAALSKCVSCVQQGKESRVANLIWGAFWSIHHDVPVMHVPFVD
jgi:hypothetical protein